MCVENEVKGRRKKGVLKRPPKYEPNMSSRSSRSPAVLLLDDDEAVEEEELSPSPDVVVVDNAGSCCLIDDGRRCLQPATSATFNKRLINSTQNRRRKLVPDLEVIR